MKILNELDKYTKNIVLRYQLKYDIIKTFKGKKLNDNLSVLYEEINLLSDKIKKEINNLFFDAGILFYEQKKYEKSYKALDEYLKLNTLNEDKLPKALYIAGVAAQKNGLIIKAKMYFNKLLKKYPNSEFTPYAKTALEDINWNEKLKK
jgi:tetratricopeptide (TPR) repeat protein